MTRGFKIAVVASVAIVVVGFVLVGSRRSRRPGPARDPGRAARLVAVGDSLWGEGRLGDATESYREAATLDSSSVVTKLAYARAIAARGRLSAAASLYGDAVASGVEEHRPVLFDLRWRLHQFRLAFEAMQVDSVPELRGRVLLASALADEAAWNAVPGHDTTVAPFVVSGEPVIAVRLGGGDAVPVRLTLSDGGCVVLSHRWAERAPIILIHDLEDTTLSEVPAIVDTMAIGSLVYTAVPALVVPMEDRRSVGVLSAADLSGPVEMDFVNERVAILPAGSPEKASAVALPAWFLGGEVHVPASLDGGVERMFAVDIAAARSAIAEDYALECGVFPDDTMGASVRVSVGVLTIPLEHPRWIAARGRWFGGVLGRDAFSDLVVRIDYARCMMYLSRG